MDRIRRSIVIALLLTLGPVVPSHALAQNSDKQADKMKAELRRLGTGPNARVRLELRNGKRINGYISEIKDKTFIVISEQSGSATEVEYTDARKASWKAPKALIIGLAVGAVVGFFAIVGYLARGE